MRALAVPLAAVLVIAAFVSVTAYREFQTSGEEEVVYGFPSDLEAASDPVVNRNGARSPAPSFKGVKQVEPQPAEDPFASTDQPPRWLAAAFELLAALGLFGEDDGGLLDDVDRRGFGAPAGRSDPAHDFSAPDPSDPYYRARTPNYPTASDRFGRPIPERRTITTAPRGLSN